MEQKPQTTALKAFVKLVRSTESVLSRVHSVLPGLDLTISQFGVLEALLHCGSLHQKGLADRILRSPGNLTTVLENLQRRGLVNRQVDAQDRRRQQISLTQSGLKLAEKAFSEVHPRIEQEFSTLTDDEIRSLSAICRKLGRPDNGSAVVPAAAVTNGK